VAWFLGDLRCSLQKQDDEWLIESDYDESREGMEFQPEATATFKEPL